jgi:hypothetical protein
MHDWKSTASAVLTGMIGTCTTVTAFLAPYLMTAPHGVAARLSLVSAGCTLLALILKVWVGVITKNADAGAVAAAINNAAQAGPGAMTYIASDLTAPPITKG